MSTAVFENNETISSQDMIGLMGARRKSRRLSTLGQGITRSDLRSQLLRENAQLSSSVSEALFALQTLPRELAKRQRRKDSVSQLQLLETTQLRSPLPSKAMVHWYLKGEISLEELILQMYYGAVSLAEVETVASTLWPNEKGITLQHDTTEEVVQRIEQWLNRRLEDSYPYVYLTSVEVRQRRLTESRKTRLAAAVGVNRQGYRELLGTAAVSESSSDVWDELLANLATRGMRSPQLFVGEVEYSPRAAIKRHFHKSPLMTSFSELEQALLAHVEASHYYSVAAMIADIKANPMRAKAERAIAKLGAKLNASGHAAVYKDFQNAIHEQLACFAFPQEHGRCFETSTMKLVLKRCRERLRIIGPIMDERIVALLAATSFRHQCRIAWSVKPFCTFDKLKTKSQPPHG